MNVPTTCLRWLYFPEISSWMKRNKTVLKYPLRKKSDHPVTSALGRKNPSRARDHFLKTGSRRWRRCIVHTTERRQEYFFLVFPQLFHLPPTESSREASNVPQYFQILFSFIRLEGFSFGELCFFKLRAMGREEMNGTNGTHRKQWERVIGGRYWGRFGYIWQLTEHRQEKHRGFFELSTSSKKRTAIENCWHELIQYSNES